jgi:hypothetical protein
MRMVLAVRTGEMKMARPAVVRSQAQAITDTVLISKIL